MNLLVEIGNTALKAAWTGDGVTLGKAFRYQGERVVDYIISLVEKEKPFVMTIASVYDISVQDESRLSKHCTHLILMDPSHKEYVVKYGFPEYLGCDRAASSIAARYLFKGKGCTIVDLGNTLTYDFIRNDGSYECGYVSLGCRTRLKALNRYSKALPLINMPHGETEYENTLKSSIEEGIISGIKFELQGHIDSHPDNVVLFTGGDAIYFVRKIKNSIFVVCNLVLMGLALITEDYVGQNNQ